MSAEVDGVKVVTVLWDVFRDTWRAQKLRFAAFEGLARDHATLVAYVEKILNFLRYQETDKVMYISQLRFAFRTALLGLVLRWK